MKAKRAARAAQHGLDLEAVNAQIHRFVTSRKDMMVCPVAGCSKQQRHPASEHAKVKQAYIVRFNTRFPLAA